MRDASISSSAWSFSCVCILAKKFSILIGSWACQLKYSHPWCICLKKLEHALKQAKIWKNYYRLWINYRQKLFILKMRWDCVEINKGITLVKFKNLNLNFQRVKRSWKIIKIKNSKFLKTFTLKTLKPIWKHLKVFNAIVQLYKKWQSISKEMEKK